MPIRTRVLRTWIGWISAFGNFGVVLAKFVWGCEIPTTILTLNTNYSWSIMIHKLKPEKRLLQVIYLNLARYGQQLKSRSIYFLCSKRPTFADFGCDFESVRRLLDPHCSTKYHWFANTTSICGTFTLWTLSLSILMHTLGLGLATLMTPLIPLALNLLLQTCNASWSLD